MLLLFWFAATAGVFRPAFADDYQAFCSSYFIITMLLVFLRFGHVVGVAFTWAHNHPQQPPECNIPVTYLNDRVVPQSLSFILLKTF